MAAPMTCDLRSHNGDVIVVILGAVTHRDSAKCHLILCISPRFGFHIIYGDPRREELITEAGGRVHVSGVVLL